MRSTVVIDADPGIGDALAIALAILDPELEVLGLTAVPGCVSGEMALLNLQAVVSLLDPPRWPRIGGSEGRSVTLPQEAPLVDPVFLNGETGLGDLDVPHVDLHHRVDAAKLLTELVREHPGELTLLTLGPLTNVALAAERWPEFLGNLKELVILGGAVSVNGDVTAAAEFNIYGNPDAARLVLTSRATKTLVPLDVAHKVLVSFEQYNRVQVDPDTRFGRLIDQTIPFALRANRQRRGIEGMLISEVVALVCLLKPQLFERITVPVDVECQGSLTRGMTICDRRKNSQKTANADVLIDVDGQGVIDYLSQRLR